MAAPYDGQRTNLGGGGDGGAAAVAAHEADTTSIHGITDTSQVALKNAANTFATGPQTVALATDVVGVLVKGSASQSVNLTEWRTSANALLSRMDQLGRLYMGVNSNIQFDAINGQIILDASVNSAGSDRLDIKLPAAESRRALRVLSSAGAELFTVNADGRIAFGDPASDVSIRKGAGTPEGAVSAPVGSLFLRSDGGASTTLYVKQSGAGNTGWVAK